MENTTFKVRLSAKLLCGAVLLISLVVIGLSYFTYNSISEYAGVLINRLNHRTQKMAGANATPSGSEALPERRSERQTRSEKPQKRPSFDVLAPASDRLLAKLAGKIVPGSGGKRRDPMRYDQPGEAAEFYRLKRLPAGATEIPVERYLDALEEMRQMPQYSTEQARFLPSRAEMSDDLSAASLPAWTPLGPGNIGGRTRAILIHPTDPQIMYAAGVAGGVWKTTNGGAAWTPLDDLLPSLAISSMAMDPTNSEVIYAGTGEIFSGDGVRGAGVLKTINGGTSWTRLPNTNNSNFHYVNDIVVSPVNSQRVYAATRTGVWRSFDGGSSWTNALTPTNSSGDTVSGGCLDLAIRTDQSTDYIFASCGTFEQATVYRNTNASGSGGWTAVLTESGMGRTSLAIAPSNQNIVYAAAASVASGNYNDGLHAVFRSTTGGASGSWTARVRNTDATKLNRLLFTNPLYASFTDCQYGSTNSFLNQGLYDNVIAVDPLDSNRVWVGGIDLFRSDDGGANWGLASYWWAGGRSPAPTYVHADNHALVFHPHYNGTSNRTLFAGNDGGIFRTDDARSPVAMGTTAACYPANSGVVWTSLNNNYGVTQFYHGAPYPDGATYFGGTQDNGTLRGSDSGGANAWDEISGGDGGYVAVDPTNTDILYVEYTGISISKSTDGGNTFRPATSGINDRGSFINPFVMDPSDPQRLWTGGEYIWRTTDGANSWTRASAITAGGGLVSAIAVAPSNANSVLVGMSDGFILRTTAGLTTNSATTWFNTQPRIGYASWVAFDPTNHNIAYATYSTFGGTHVWRSTNGGASWTGIDGSGATRIPDIPVHCIVVDPTNTARLFVGTDLGVFVSTNGGASWAVENTGFANVVTESLAMNRTASGANLFAFTHGRGAWRVSLGSGGGGSNCPTASNINPASGAAGASVTISGANFTGVTAVRFANNVNAAFTVNSDTQITTTAPLGAVTGPITISKPNCPDATTSVFTVTSGCAHSINPTGQSFPASGGGGSVTVNTQAGCGWTATRNDSWITITSGASGSGDGAVNYFVDANTGANQRVGTMTIAGHPFTVTQSGVSSNPTPSLTGIIPNSTPAGGAAFTLTVTGANFVNGSVVRWNGSDRATNFINSARLTAAITASDISALGTASITVANPAPGGGVSNARTFTISFPKSISGHMISGGPIFSNCQPPSAQYSFTATDQRAIQWTYISDLEMGDVIRWEFIQPNGTIYFQTELSLSFSGPGCLWAWINIIGQPPASLPGNWQARLFCNNVRLLTDDFTIMGLTPSLTSINPNSASAGGAPFTLTVNGSGFVNGSVVRWNGNDRATTFVSGSQLTAQIPATDIAVAGTANVRVFNPGGGLSSPLNFTINQNCNYSISPTGRNFTVDGGTGSVTVDATSGCAWTATSNASWLTITSGASGAGPGAVNYSVAANPGASPRSGALNIAGRVFSIFQNGCVSLGSFSRYFETGGGVGSLTVNAASGCVWTATSSASWLTLTGATSGAGGGAINYSVAPNPFSGARVATINVSGNLFYVEQRGNGAACATTPIAFGQTVNGNLSASDCVSPSRGIFGAHYADRYTFGGVSGQRIAILQTSTAIDSYAFLIGPDGSILYANDDGGGSRNSRIPFATGFYRLPATGVYTVEATSYFAGRTGDYALSLSATCVELSPVSQTFTGDGGGGSVAVIAPAGCLWTAVSDASWLTVNSGAGNGGGTINYSVAPNLTGRPRRATLTVAGDVFVVSQSSDGSTLSTDDDAFEDRIGYGGGDGYYVNRLTPTSYPATLSAVSVYFAAGGVQPGEQITILVGANPGGGDNINNVAWQTINATVQTLGQFNVFTIPQMTINSGDFVVGFRSSAAYPCPFDMTLPTMRRSYTSSDGRSFSQIEDFSLAGNFGIRAHLTATPSCNYLIAPTSQSFGAGGGGGVVSVTAASGCVWTAASNDAWITITSGANGSGSGLVSYAVDPNNSSTQRTGTMTIAGQAFTLTQAGSVNPTPTLTLSFNGKARDRVGQGDAALSPDGLPDGVFTATLSPGGGTRAVVRLDLRRSAGGQWNTAPGDDFWALGAAGSLDTPLFNYPNGTVDFSMAGGGSFVLFASDYNNSLFNPGDSFTLTVNFADGTTATANTTILASSVRAGNPSTPAYRDGEEQRRHRAQVYRGSLIQPRAHGSGFVK